jgi:MFS family permease
MTLVAFEGIAVATVMPVVGRELDGLGVYAWAFNAYVVASLVGMVGAGTWCDRRGPRLPLQVGSLVFGVGALMAGFAPTMGVLIAARGIQGLGGGAVIVAVYVLIARAFDESLRPRAFSLLAAAWVVPSMAGPFVAGWLAESITWRAAFWLVPIVMILPLVALRGVLRVHDGGTGE